jgi:transcriptional regulator with XRE-family HTH domain
VETLHDFLSDLHDFLSAGSEIVSAGTGFVMDSPEHHWTFITSLIPVPSPRMENPVHVQLRAAREAHGLTQHELAARAGVGRSDIQRLERGDNVGIRLLEKVLAQLPDLTTFQMGGIEVTGRITVDVDSVRQIVLGIVAAGTQALQVLEQARPSERPAELQGPAGATRFVPKPVLSEEFKEYLRRIDPTDKGPKPAAKADRPGDRPRAGVDPSNKSDSEH